MELVHCIYCSSATAADLSSEDLERLLEQCRRNNAKLDVSGILLYQDRSFFQILEGDRKVVASLFEKISKDPRHTRTTKIIVEPIEQRAFEQWTMGHSKLTARELAHIPGLNDFFARGLSYMDIGEGRAKQLLAAFAGGKWRSTLA
jgi:Sensors of blue-light using FAD